MLETAHIAYTTTLEMSSSDDVDELCYTNLCSCITLGSANSTADLDCMALRVLAPSRDFPTGYTD